MPVLAKHDPLAVQPITVEIQIDQARALYENDVQTSRGRLVLTPETRSRLEAVSASLAAKDAAGALAGASSSTVDWAMDDGTIANMTAAEIQALIGEAQVLIGEKTQRSFAYAQSLKVRLRAKEQLSMRLIARENWL